MSVLQTRKFTFTWQIVNFSMCPQKFKEKIFSPVFVLSDDSEWQLALFPQGAKHKNVLCCFLYCRGTGSHSELVNICHRYTIFSYDAEKCITLGLDACEFITGGKMGLYLDLLSDIVDDRKAYLPNDTLTIKCKLWLKEYSELVCDTDGEDQPLDEDSEGVDMESEKDHIEENEMLPTTVEYNSDWYQECSVATYIQVCRRNISWSIKDFSSISFEERLEALVPTALKNAPTFRLALFKSIEERSVEIDIKIEKNDSLKRTLVKCKALVLQTPKGVSYFAEGEKLFEFDSNIENTSIFPTFIKLNKLQEDDYLNGTNDVLHLRFEFTYSQLDDMHHIERLSFHKCGMFVNYPESIPEFGKMYKNGDSTDATIRTSNLDFKVHKNILKARSPIFAAMFNNDMKESQTCVLDIGDVDPKTMDRLLAFMYSNALEDLKPEDALALYAAADEYQVQSLKCLCTWILASSLSVSNVCDVLVLAEQRKDEYLRDCAENFVCANIGEVFKSQKWENLIKDYGTIAANVMLKMITY